MLCRLLLGGTFLLSGFVKVADPMGMAYKLEAYAEALALPFAHSLLPMEMAATALGTVEFVLGLCLLLGVNRRLTVGLSLLATCVLTALTVWIYVAEPVQDCGCFGEAITLPNGQTLAKNVVLLVAALCLLYRPLAMRRVVSERFAWLASTYAWCYTIALAIYTLHYIPVLDFTPYRIGVNMRAAFDNPEQAEAERLPVNFYVADTQTGDDLTWEILADTSYTFLLTGPRTETADDGCCDRINSLYDFCQDRRYAFCMLTASDSAGCADWKDRTGAAYPIYMAEDTEIRAMVRSNPGLMLLKDGRLVWKWGNNELPDPYVHGNNVAQWFTPSGAAPLLRLVLWFLIPLLLVVIIDNVLVGTKYYRHHLFKLHLNKQKAMRKKIVAGNWKMNMNLQEGVALAKELNEALAADKPNCGVVICTPFIHLASVAGVIDSNVIGLGAENCADKVKGAYTGEVSAEMVKSTGADYVILGHSERRAYYHETAEILKEKVNLALANGLEVIFCIGEVLEEREAGKQNEVVKAQLEGSLFDLTAEQFAHVVLAYEPVWAIGTGKTATSDQAEEMHAFIRATIAEKFGKEAAENVTILYGGSCKPSNAKELFAKPDVDGGLIGGASLKVADFKGIIDAWK